MTAVTRVGDMNTGHDACPPVPLSAGSPNVYANSIPVGRIGDPYVPHGCVLHPEHVGHISSGSPTVIVNGIPAGRIGDSVDCGPTVAEGSPNVILDDGVAGIAESILFAMATVLLKAKNFYTTPVVKQIEGEDVITYEPTSETNKTIMSLPEIARHIANESSSDLDKKGWNYLAQMFDRWLGNSAGPLNSGEHAFFVDYEWLKSYAGINYYHNELVNNALNEAGQKLLLDTLKEKALLNNNEFDLTQYYYTNDIKYCNSRALGEGLSYVRYNYKTAPGAYAAMGAFMIYAIPKGTIEQLEENKYRITVTDLYTCAKDSFQFENASPDKDQSYNYWSYKKNNFNIFKTPGNSSFVELKNSDFNKFRMTYNKGKDFYVKSDLFKIDNFEPVSFEITDE